MNLYLACFDIQDDRARRYIARELERYGVRVQKLVFELVVSKNKELAALKQRLQQSVEDDWLPCFHCVPWSSRCNSQNQRIRVSFIKPL